MDFGGLTNKPVPHMCVSLREFSFSKNVSCFRESGWLREKRIVEYGAMAEGNIKNKVAIRLFTIFWKMN